MIWQRIAGGSSRFNGVTTAVAQVRHDGPHPPVDDDDAIIYQAELNERLCCGMTNRR